MLESYGYLTVYFRVLRSFEFKRQLHLVTIEDNNTNKIVTKK